MLILELWHSRFLITRMTVFCYVSRILHFLSVKILKMQILQRSSLHICQVKKLELSGQKNVQFPLQLMVLM